jgi:SAM-dependent methyltransferase
MEAPWDKWDERYGAEGFAFGTSPSLFLAEVADRIPVGKVLCLCEGEGRNGVFLAERGHRVHAVDYSSVGLAKAQELATGRGVELATHLMDIAEYKIDPESWDGIVSIFCHLARPLRALVHEAVVAGLRPGGVYILEAYTPRQLEMGTGGPSSVERLPTLADLTHELEGLELEIGQEIERDVTEGEGRYHSGRAAVVQVAARKAEA